MEAPPASPSPSNASGMTDSPAQMTIPDGVKDAEDPVSQGTNDTQESPAEKPDDTDNLLVAFGLGRTRGLRKQLVDEKTHKPYERYDMTSAPLFADYTDTDFIKELDKSFHDEFEFLTSADQITVERGSGHVIGGYGPDGNLSPSELLFGKFYPEVDRTIVGILTMKWILADNYDKFTGFQAPPVKLKKNQFEEMREVFIKAIKNSGGSYMLIVSMIVNDLGKNSKLRQRIRDEEPRWEVMNHDEVIYHAAKHGKLPLINEFDKRDKDRLMKGIQFGGKINLGQLAQGENVPGSLREIAQLMEGDEDAFPMKFCEIVLDVAGANGHIDSRGANAWISPVNEAYSNAHRCVIDVMEGTKTIKEAYDGVLNHRAQLLMSQGFKELRVTHPEERSILRLITMSRATSPKAAEAVENALNNMDSGYFARPLKDLLARPIPNVREALLTALKDLLARPIPNVREALLTALNVSGLDDGIAIIPYYGPGILAEAARVTKAEAPEMQSRAMSAVFRFFARVLLQTRPVKGRGGYVVECDINWAGETIRGEEFLKNPIILDDIECPKKDPYGDDIKELVLKVYGLWGLSQEAHCGHKRVRSCSV